MSTHRPLPPSEAGRETCVRNFMAMIETIAPLLTAEEMVDGLAFLTAQASRHADIVEQHRRRRDQERMWEEAQLLGQEFARREREPA